jgi:hypothetical protein
MDQFRSGSSMESDSSLGPRFPLRPVPLGEVGQLLRDSIAPFRFAPLRLTGLFLVLWIPILMLVFAQTVGPFLSEIASAVAFTGYTAALDAAARSEPPDFRHLGVVVRFDFEKLALLMLSGLVPILAAVLVLYGIWGMQETAQFVQGLSSADGHPSPRLMIDFEAAEYIAGIPFSFVAPVWALYRWSGSRSMSANLLACVVNWRWVLVMTGFEAFADNLLIWMRGQGDDVAILSDIGVIATQMLALSWTLAVAQRSFPLRRSDLASTASGEIR